MPTELTLYSYWRSSAAYRARIALNLKQLSYTVKPVSLLRGEQRAAEFREMNPQELIPILHDGERVIRQSLAIIEYLDETYTEGPPLLPVTARARARVRGIAQAIACDIHPICNLRVQQYLEKEFKASERSEEHTSELQSPVHLVCRFLLEKKKKHTDDNAILEHLVPHIN